MTPTVQPEIVIVEAANTPLVLKARRSPVMPPDDAGHCGAGKAVGSGSGVEEGRQPKPVQPPAGHV